MAQWKSAWLQTEGSQVRASPASLRCGPWARHIYPSLVLVEPRKTRPCLAERLLMRLKESNQTNCYKHPKLFLSSDCYISISDFQIVHWCNSIININSWGEQWLSWKSVRLGIEWLLVQVSLSAKSLCSVLNKKLYRLLNTGSTLEDQSPTWLKNCWRGRKESKQNKKKISIRHVDKYAFIMCIKTGWILRSQLIWIYTVFKTLCKISKKLHCIYYDK